MLDMPVDRKMPRFWVGTICGWKFSFKFCFSHVGAMSMVDATLIIVCASPGGKYVFDQAVYLRFFSVFNCYKYDLFLHYVWLYRI